ncbi:MAG: arylesterase [Balneolaceae bacterium]|nr:arylesterase [Balneolaceae bacterium]
MKRLFTSLFLIFIVAFTAQSQSNIMFFGDSITAGLGVQENQAYPALVQQKIDSLGWNFNVINAGLSGETSAGGLRRVDWMLRQEIDVFVLELGGNDGLRGIDLKSTKSNLQKIIDKVEAKYPDTKIILAGMEVPPNLGPDYTKQFREMYAELAQSNDISLIPFLLQGVGRNPNLMQSDGIHPNVAGHKKVAEVAWETLKPILQNMRTTNG